jgi:hypothetical protein
MTAGAGPEGSVAVDVVRGDARELACDALLLKWAGGPHGLDEVVAAGLGVDPTSSLGPSGAVAVAGETVVAAPQVVFIAAPPLHLLRYREIRAWTRQALAAAAIHVAGAGHVALTLHGAGYGLDEEACVAAEVAGLVEAVAGGRAPAGLGRITLVERNPRRAERIRRVVAEVLPGSVIGRGTTLGPKVDRGHLPVIHVAMPLSGATEDLFRHGIEPAITATGHLVERIIPGAADGVAQVETRLSAAAGLVADITGSHPNVYLQVGYAWGRGIPTVVIVGTGDEAKIVPLDLRTRAQIVFEDTDDLRRRLGPALAAVGLSRPSGSA